jgi:hypothetical protein
MHYKMLKKGLEMVQTMNKIVIILLLWNMSVVNAQSDFSAIQLHFHHGIAKVSDIPQWNTTNIKCTYYNNKDTLYCTIDFIINKMNIRNTNIEYCGHGTDYNILKRNITYYYPAVYTNFNIFVVACNNKNFIFKKRKLKYHLCDMKNIEER